MRREYSLPGAEFLVDRYKAARAVPAEQRSHDVAAFVRSYELIGDVVQALPYIQTTPPAPPPLPTDVLCASLLKYLEAQHTCVGTLVYPDVWVPRIFAQLYPMWCSQVTFSEGPGGPPGSGGSPGPAFSSACDPATPLARDGEALLPSLLRTLCLGELLSIKPFFYRESQQLVEKVAKALRNRAHAAKIRQELAALGQGPPACRSSSSNYGSGGDGVSSSSEGGGLIMTFEELECYTLWLLVNLASLQAKQWGACDETFTLLDRGKAAAKRMIALAPKDPTSHYALAKIYNTLGELPGGLAALEDCLAAAEQLGAQYNIALYATSVGFCAIELFDERCQEGNLARRPRAIEAERRRLAQRLAALVDKARTASRAVKGLLPEPCLGMIRTHRARLKALAQRFASEAGVAAAPVTPEQQELARIPTAADNVAARELHCANCGLRALSAKACGGCRRVYYCSKECQREHWRDGHREECRA